MPTQLCRRALLFSAMLTLIACGSSSDKGGKEKQARVSDNSSRLLTSEEVAQDFVPSTQDASLLEVFNLSIVNTSKANVNTQALNFVQSAGADFIEYQSCSLLKKECSVVKQTVLQQGFLPEAIESGKRIATARACVNAARAVDKSVTCGKWVTLEYLPMLNNNSNIASLLREKEKLSDEIKNIVENMHGVLQKYISSAKVCEAQDKYKQQIIAYRGMAQTFLAIGDKVVSASLSNPNANGVNSLNVNFPVDKIRGYLSKYTVAFQSIPEINAYAEQFSASLGLFDKAQPVAAVETFGLAIFDLFTAPAQVNQTCSAQVIASDSMKALQTQLASVQELLKNIQKQLQEGVTK